LEKAVWDIPPEKMKMRQPHLVPLSDQVVAILRDLHPLTGGGKYVFPGVRSARRPMSENTVTAALRYMGFDGDTMTGHGFRAMARTVIDEELGFPVDHIEHQLAHAVRDANGRAYNRTSHLPARRKMMQAWADYLDGLRVGTAAAPLSRQTT
jgi:integrase